MEGTEWTGKIEIVLIMGEEPHCAAEKTGWAFVQNWGLVGSNVMKCWYVRRSCVWEEVSNFMVLGLSRERHAADSSGINVAIAETEGNRLKVNP
jgi:hypothetical protein